MDFHVRVTTVQLHQMGVAPEEGLIVEGFHADPELPRVLCGNRLDRRSRDHQIARTLTVEQKDLPYHTLSR
jgi:hypothetical protein